MAVKCKDAEAALVLALEIAVGQPPDRRLAEVSFGQYAAAGAGWWYSLKFLTEFSLDESTMGEPVSVRIDRIVRTWAADVEKYKPTADGQM